MEYFLDTVGELAGIPLCDVDQGLRRLLSRCAALLGADDGFWIAAVRSAPKRESNSPLARTFSGWEPVQIISLHDNAQRRQLRQLILRRSEQGFRDPYTDALVSQSGEDRALLRSDVIRPAQEAQHWMYRDVFAPGLIRDRMVGASSLSGDAETYLGFDRLVSDRPFSQHERELLRFICVGLKWFFAGLHRSYGLIDAIEPLTQRERQVLLLALTDKSEKQMAADLGVSPKTLHHHISALYRKFAVNSRAGLMALWLNYRPKPLQ